VLSRQWLLLLHQIPPKPAYFRARVLRRLNQVGALALKNSAYLLPQSEDTQEDLEWLRREIETGGGEAWLFEVRPRAGLTDESLTQAFRLLRKPDFEELVAEARRLLDEARTAIEPRHEAEWRRLERRCREVAGIDFFGAPGREELEGLMSKIDRALHAPLPAAPATRPLPEEMKGRIWVTRRAIKVDRIACAWLIRRFIDPEAAFRFVDPGSYQHTPGELRFDMFEGEFTHEGDQCTFEVLLAWSGLAEPALRAVAELVHDLDLKDQKYQRPEAPGLAPLIEGMVIRDLPDEKRLEEGGAIFESLYARLRAEGGRT
jgi:hypothetical protein